MFQNQKKEHYDPETGCIKQLNELSKYHNRMLSEEIGKLRLFYPDATIILADYFEAAMNIYRNPKKLGEISQSKYALDLNQQVTRPANQ
jgi:hypothetical protein